jgi:valyl-tRNA synthetase
VIRPYIDEPNLAAHLPIAKYPEPSATNPLSSAEEIAMSHCIEVTRIINTLRASLGYPPGEQIAVKLRAPLLLDQSGESSVQVLLDEIAEWGRYAKVLARVKEFEVVPNEIGSLQSPLPGVWVQAELGWCRVFAQASEKILQGAAKAAGQAAVWKQKQIDEIQLNLKRHRDRLANPEFLAKASPETQEETRRKEKELVARLSSLTEGQ